MVHRSASILVWSFLFLGSLCLIPTPPASGNSLAPTDVDYVAGRIAVDADGNFNDPDDWAATPATLAILARQELQGKLVHYSYNNSLGANANDAIMYAQMTQGTLRSADRFAFDRGVFFDLQTELVQGIENLRAQVDRSSGTDPLFIIAAGPMEFLWRTINASDPSARRFVTVISHSPWNNNRVFPPAMSHTAADVQALGVNWVQISDQNEGFSSGQRWSPWEWLRDAAELRIRRIYDRMRTAGIADISDAGMAYFLVTGDQMGDPEKLRVFLGDWSRSPHAPALALEAEDASFVRGRIERDHDGFSGEGFFNYDNVVGSSLRFNVNAPATAIATLTFRFANASSSNRPLRISVNSNVVRSSLPFPATGDWNSWRTQSFEVWLRAGLNTINAQATTDAGGPNVDGLRVSPRP